MTENNKNPRKKGQARVAPLGLKEKLKEATPEERRQILDGLPHDRGFGKPPKETQFQKGKSGNPKGRPKGSENLRTIVAEVLAEPVVVFEGGQKRKMSNARVMVLQAVKKAVGGDLKALAVVNDFARRAGQFEEKHEQSAPVFSPGHIETAGAVIAAYEAAPEKEIGRGNPGEPMNDSKEVKKAA